MVSLNKSELDIQKGSFNGNYRENHFHKVLSLLWLSVNIIIFFNFSSK